MKNYETQQAEIQTIKPRTITLNLSDADVERLYAKAYENGITPAELLEGFIGDLLDGTYSHGSDERDLANQYFDRCSYDLWVANSRSLLQWALHNYWIDDIVSALEHIADAENEFAYYEEYPEDAAEHPEEVQAVRDAKEYAETELQKIYKEYAAAVKEPQNYTDGMNEIKEYLRAIREGMRV